MGLSEEFMNHLWEGVVGSLVYGVLGILLTVIGFKVFDWALPKIDIQRELTEKANLAVAIVAAAAIVGVSLIIMAAVN